MNLNAFKPILILNAMIKMALDSYFFGNLYESMRIYVNICEIMQIYAFLCEIMLIQTQLC